MTTQQRAVRSHLFAPANNERLLTKVFVAGADAVVFDLEDAVAPSEKESARKVLATALAAREQKEGPEVWVRINGYSTDLWREDLAAAVGPWLTGIRLPKAESVDAVHQVSDALARCEAEAGLEAASVSLLLTVESALGVSNCEALASCQAVSGFTFGNVDFLADVGARDSEDGVAALYAHSRMVLASRVAGISPPVAPVHTRLDDLDGLRITSERYKNLGFFGRSCIHPKQLPVVHEVFTPSAREISQAREIVAAYDAGLSKASGVEVTDDGQFVDLAVVLRARAVIELADSLGV